MNVKSPIAGFLATDSLVTLVLRPASFEFEIQKIALETEFRGLIIGKFIRSLLLTYTLVNPDLVPVPSPRGA